MVERKIYSPWAFTENSSDKAKMNCEIYQEIKDKAVKIYREGQATAELLKTKSVVLDYAHGYGHTKYKVLSNPHNLTNTQLALICDDGNLCFGHCASGNIIKIYID
jgi:hypothetical protein